MLKAFLTTIGILSLPVAATAQDWSGPYAGGSIGIGSGDLEVFDSDEYTAYGYARADGFMAAVSAKAGYNFQSGSLVYGPELSFGVTTLAASEEFDFCSPTTINNELQTLAMLRGRIGFAVDNVLIYGAAGAAVANGNFEAACDTSYTDSVDQVTAFVAGFGAEIMYTDTISLNFEYTAMRGDDKYVSASDSSDPEDKFGFNLDADIFTVGVSYHF